MIIKWKCKDKWDKWALRPRSKLLTRSSAIPRRVRRARKAHQRPSLLANKSKSGKGYARAASIFTLLRLKRVIQAFVVASSFVAPHWQPATLFHVRFINVSPRRRLCSPLSLPLLLACFWRNFNNSANWKSDEEMKDEARSRCRSGNVDSNRGGWIDSKRRIRGLKIRQRECWRNSSYAGRIARASCERQYAR